ncbi:MAG: endonuclease III domain-containing protein [Firmicutes bacterium]|nr:endonuclease III domain-containing protein [Bacillota bacterium]
MLKEKLLQIYAKLFDHFGPQYWWPAKTRFEVMVGAVLTQAVAWRNVVKAVTNLEKAGLLSPLGLYHADPLLLMEYLKPTRYYKMKLKKLQAMVNFIVDEYQGDLDLMFKEELPELRKKLLGVYGLGPETVDSILLYAGSYPVFVVDEYTRRIFSRLGLVAGKISYEKLRQFFEKNLPESVELYNEFHALIVALGNQTCSITPKCLACPLRDECNYFRNQSN